MTDEDFGLESQGNEAEWSLLLPHAQADRLIIVSLKLQLYTVANAVAADDRDLVQGWVDAGEIAKPTPEQLKLWDATPTKPFRMAIVQPFVLAQEIPMN